jgi:hypothetical protein
MNDLTFIHVYRLYCSGDQNEKNEKGGDVTRMVDRRGIYRVLVGKS